MSNRVENVIILVFVITLPRRLVVFERGTPGLWEDILLFFQIFDRVLKGLLTLFVEIAIVLKGGDRGVDVPKDEATQIQTAVSPVREIGAVCASVPCVLCVELRRLHLADILKYRNLATEPVNLCIR